MVKNKLAGIIFGDSYDVDMKEMLEMRTLAGVPFGARYRVIDFLLSNMVNAGIKNIGVITTQKYLSLMKHVSAGAPWDLDRKNSGLTFLPPFNSESIKTVYENRLEALQANISWLRDVEEEYILITVCNYVGNLDFSKMLEAHEKSGAMITAL
jgi:glucose-1-phosphate adenylyltransferase